MKNYDAPDLLVAFCLGVFAMSVLSEIGEWIAPDIRKQAIERGYAEYIVDSNGKATWQWK